jgi:hypothetical protein
VAAALAGCSDDGGSGDGDSSSDFTVEAPDGYHLLAEGTGEGQRQWGDDSSGNTGPFVVLGGSDDPTHQLTTFELGGFQGFQGGLNQALGYVGDAPAERIEADGRPALAVSTRTFASVVADGGDDLAAITRSTVLGRDDLVALIEGADLPEGEQPAEPPTVDPPDGWTVLGSATADLNLALGAYGEDGYVGGPASAHVRLWRVPVDNQLMALTLPGSAGDVGAVVGYPLVTSGFEADEVERFELDDRDAVWLANESNAVLATTTDWGDLLLLLWGPDGVDAQPADRSVLEAIAASAEPA